MSGDLIREKRIISLNSNSATRYNNSTFLSDIVFDFVNILSPDDSIVYTECGVGNAEIPASFYNIDITNNIFNLMSGSVPLAIMHVTTLEGEPIVCLDIIH